MKQQDMLKIGPVRTEGSGPKVQCALLADFPSGKIEALRHAFAGASPLALRQAWLDKPEPDFAPGSVRVGWRNGSLLLLAELNDADIFTEMTKLNQKAWLLGDAFEIFLRPIQQAAYIEFHVTPNNQHLQLRFPDAAAVVRADQDGTVESLMLPGQVFHSKTWVQPEAGRWFIFAEIPAGAVGAESRSLSGCQWFFSFSRYDYTRGRKEPVISSTSPHALANFHRQQEWGLMTFK
jgi:hypothetical protein